MTDSSSEEYAPIEQVRVWCVCAVCQQRHLTSCVRPPQVEKSDEYGHTPDCPCSTCDCCVHGEADWGECDCCTSDEEDSEDDEEEEEERI